jgi:hypothetical protein
VAPETFAGQIGTEGNFRVGDDPSRILGELWRRDGGLDCHVNPSPLTGERSRSPSAQASGKQLYEDGDQTGDHKRSGPHQVDVEPSLTEKREAYFTIDHPCDQPGNRKVASRMDGRGEHPG